MLPSRGRAPGYALAEADGVLRLTASGSWTIREVAEIDREVDLSLRRQRGGGVARGEILVADLDQLDTAGAWLLGHIREAWERLGLATRIVGATEEHRILLDEVREHAATHQSPPGTRHPALRLLEDIGGAVRSMLADAVDLTAFLGAVTACLVRVCVMPWRFRGIAFTHHLEHSGLRAVPIVSLICALIGAVILQQGAVQLRPYGAEPFSVNMLTVLALREVGVLLTAILVAGRSASATTAEIGAMRMREEIDAMRALGIDPLETLVLPRVLALMVALPILAFIGDIMCLAGGCLVAQLYLGLDTATFVERLLDVNVLKHLTVGLVKTPLAAIIIGLIGCLEGLRVRGSAESLGRHVTSAVVKAIFLVICADGLFAIFIAGMGY